ncbi:family 43 glycosylhydrolase [Novipirellula herctigrandis]
MNTLLSITILLMAGGVLAAEDVAVRNPALPGFHADPSVIVHDGRIYAYATKDPWGGEDLGCFSTVDFKTWQSHKLNWPTLAACVSPTKSSAKVWAPEVIRGPDGRFYMYVSVGSEIYAGVASKPTGPWQNITGGKGPMVFTQADEGVHTIDASPFIDEDGRIFLYWGSGLEWVNGHCLVVELEKDMHTFIGEPKDITPPNYFEGPHMIKRRGKYYLMYSDGKAIDKTYKVRYSISDAPFGPFTEGKNSPILSTDENLGVYGPGHHCVFTLKGQDYIAYHRLDSPDNSDGVLREVCFQKLIMDKDGWFEEIVLTDGTFEVAEDVLSNLSR